MNNNLRSLFLLLCSSFLLALAVFGQETKEIDVNISTDKDDNFFAQPWVWVVGAAVFILILVAILRSGHRSAE